MIKLYDPNERKKVETRIEVEQGVDSIKLHIVDIDGNDISSILKIDKYGVLLYNSIDINFDSKNDVPFKIDDDGYIKITKE